MPQGNSHLDNSQAAFNSQHSSNGTINGLAQPMDPMSPTAPNPYELMDKKAGNHYSQHAPQVPTNAQGMPQGAAPLNVPGMAPNSNTVTDEGGSPMDKWFKKGDNSANVDSNSAPATPPAAPAPFKSLFESATMENFQQVAAKVDAVGESFTPEIQQQFTDGDFSALPSIINQAVQAGMAHSQFMGSRIAHKGVDQMLQNFQTAQLPDLLRANQVSTMWQSPELQDFNSPAMQPMVQMASNHIQQMYPNISPAELKTQTLEMLRDYSKQLQTANFNPSQPTGSNMQGSSEPQLTDMEMLFKQSN